MLWSNNFNLPDTILRAAQAQNAKYNKGEVERSATQLIMPPRIDILRKKHFHEMTKDISEEFWALFGSACHYILELGRTPNMVCEERLFLSLDGWNTSGAIDVQEFHKDGSVSLSDYKITTAFALSVDESGVKPEWEAQLNIAAYMVAMTKPVTIRDLTIVAIVRDWQRTQAQADPAYPIAPVVPVRVKLWSKQKQESYIRERIRLHRAAEMAIDLDQPLPECSAEERWSRAHTWAIMKVGGKKAAKVHYTEDEAEADLKKRKPGYVVEFRPGKSVRCHGNYCGVASWCEQWQKIKGNGEAAAPEEEVNG